MPAAKRKIIVRILKSELVDWKKIEPIQNDNLKSISEKNYKKLKKSILSNGFVDALKVWKDKKGKLWLLDGKHRKKAFCDLEKEGVEIPGKLNALFIDCKNRKQAAEFVLVFSSQYADVEQEGLVEFINLEGLDRKTIGTAIEIPTVEIDLLGSSDINLNTDFDAVRNGAFTNYIKNNSDSFEVTFIFKKEYEEIVKGAIAEAGKDKLVKQIINSCKEIYNG